MSDLFNRAQAAVGAIRERTQIAPRVGIILGPGLGGFASEPYHQVVKILDAAGHSKGA